MSRRRTPRRLDAYSTVQKRVTLALANCPRCLVLYVWLDCEVGGKPWHRTVATAAHELGWQPRTVEEHAKHLDKKSLVSIDKRTDRTTASWQLRMLHQPVRNQVSRKAKLQLPKPVAKRQPSKMIQQKRGRDGRFLRLIEGEAS